MNPEAVAELQKITSKEPRLLVPAERAFLRARESYLTKAQREEFAEILENPTNEVIDIEGNIVTPAVQVEPEVKKEEVKEEVKVEKVEVKEIKEDKVEDKPAKSKNK